MLRLKLNQVSKRGPITSLTPVTLTAFIAVSSDTEIIVLIPFSYVSSLKPAMSVLKVHIPCINTDQSSIGAKSDHSRKLHINDTKMSKIPA